MMNLLHLLIISLVAFYLFKLVGPTVFKFIGNMTVSNALLFALIFTLVYKVNEGTQLLTKLHVPSV